MRCWFVIAIIVIAGAAHAQTSTPNQILPTVNDPALSEYLTRLASDITTRANNPIACIVTILESNSINAYALPSGEVYVTRGLVKTASNEAEIVFVLAQQLSYLNPPTPTYYAQPQFKKPSVGHTLLVGLVSGALLVAGGPLGARVGVMVIAQEMDHRATLRYSSLQTAPASLITEADKAAVEYLHEAGYDPEAAITMLEKLRALRPKGYVRQSQLPPPPITFIERIRFVRQRIAKLERKSEYLLDSSTFKLLKTRLSEPAAPAPSDKLQLNRKPLTSSSNER